MEWLVLALVAAVAAAFIAWPRNADLLPPSRPATEELRAERQALLAELREIEEDTLAGRITTDDRLAARRALGPRLRQVTEALRDLGEAVEA
ncbi:MAG: hypothetical protein M0R73_10920 [Dehalococcoidia bacterium]|nr:hypothetical protein [Dehalococcoidia bacterium]